MFDLAYALICFKKRLLRNERVYGINGINASKVELPREFVGWLLVGIDHDRVTGREIRQWYADWWTLTVL